eukprot:4837958-Amphidinium_carterae.3
MKRCVACTSSIGMSSPSSTSPAVVKCTGRVDASGGSIPARATVRASHFQMAWYSPPGSWQSGHVVSCTARCA